MPEAATSEDPNSYHSDPAVIIYKNPFLSVNFSVNSDICFFWFSPFFRNPLAEHNFEMRKHGWQLPYHPLQVVAVAVFLALAFAFYVFFVPFVGKRLFQYIFIGLYTLLGTSVFGLYVWCVATDPGDPGVFKSKKYLKVEDRGKMNTRASKMEECASSVNGPNTATVGEKQLDEGVGMNSNLGGSMNKVEERVKSPPCKFCLMMFGWCPICICGRQGVNEQSSEQQMSEDGMFYCSLCEVEVFKYSQHCRVCDKCVDGFDHHCRWLNNCIGRKNYRRFFTLMVFALLLLFLQLSIGVLVLICSFLEHKRFSVEIISKLGSSFSLVPFVVVVASCTILTMIATLPLVQLFFFHVLLIKKGISTYDYIIALREQEQQAGEGGGQQSPQMSPASSLTGMSSASSFNTFHRGAWCTPPRLFLEDQFDVVPPDTGTSVKLTGKKATVDEVTRKRITGNIKISPWALARLNAEEVSKVAAQARKNSKILQPVTRNEATMGLETDSSFGSSSGHIFPKPENRRRVNKRGRGQADLAHEPVMKTSAKSEVNISSLAAETNGLAPLQLEARSAFQTSRAMSSTGIITSSPESSLDSPDLHPFGVSSSGLEESHRLSGLPVVGTQKGIQLSRSTSDGYEASGGEDSDRVPPRTVTRSTSWSRLLFSSNPDEVISKSLASSSSTQNNNRRI
ncbi:probable protein S-acyltransferase 22 [Aristolochia californica]|uniref:probable protein S-acyltransferase 22 n=1 Tax=Aristolochia californica TaxID=171875 RepID=UPI0035DBFDFD